MMNKNYRGLSCLRRIVNSLKLNAPARRREFSTVPEPEEKAVSNVKIGHKKLSELQLKYPDFIPCSKPEVRNYMREKLEHMDMMRRRSVIAIPEFYVGSIVAVTSSDPHSAGKPTRFLGICIHQAGFGLASRFILRNVINNEGVEVVYLNYSPTIQKIEVLKLEKRLDSDLFYLRDAPHEYSTFPFNMDMEYRNINDPVPVNTIKVELNPPPWLQRYERMNLQGAILPPISEKRMRKAELLKKPWEKYDLMATYRKAITEEEQENIFSEIKEDLQKFEAKNRMSVLKKVVKKPPKQKLF